MAGSGWSQEISPVLVGNNLWYAERGKAASTPSDQVMKLSGAAGIRLIRIGGRAYDDRMPSDADLLTWVQRIRATGAEPMIQVSQYKTPADAAATVRFLNRTSGAAVKWWSIGNEPWLQARYAGKKLSEAEMAAHVERYFKASAAAMKAVDPTIRIFGVNSEDLQEGLHARLFGGSNNIAGKVPGKPYYYCDGLSWHRYPQARDINPAYEGLADIHQRIVRARALVDATNISQNRLGNESLQWAIGEFNSRQGPDVHTWGNGQMFAGVYGLCMKHGATFAAGWSLRESGGQRTATDFGLLDGKDLIPRPSYWHSYFVAKYFTGQYIEGSPSISDATSGLLVFGASDPATGRISVMIINRESANPRPYILHLGPSTRNRPDGHEVLKVAAERPFEHLDIIPPCTTHVLVFEGETITRIAYSKEDFLLGMPPRLTTSQVTLPHEASGD